MEKNICSLYVFFLFLSLFIVALVVKSPGGTTHLGRLRRPTSRYHGGSSSVERKHVIDWSPTKPARRKKYGREKGRSKEMVMMLEREVTVMVVVVVVVSVVVQGKTRDTSRANAAPMITNSIRKDNDCSSRGLRL